LKIRSDFGYAGKILHVDLSSGAHDVLDSANYVDRFLGGRGLSAKMYWDEVSPGIGAFDEQNMLIFATGPLAGLPGLASSRWQVYGKSPATNPELFCGANLGGTWGAALKFAGYDAAAVRGKSEKPVYLFLHDDIVELKDAAHLWGKGAIETREMLKTELDQSVRVVAIGPAGERMVSMASILADKDASGSGGLGAVMGSKRLKAIVVKGSEKRVSVAKPEELRELTRYFQGYKRTPMLLESTGHEVLGPSAITRTKMKKDPCYGCRGCMRASYQSDDGKTGKFLCQSAWFYQVWAPPYYGEWNDVPFLANKLCDDYGLDTMALAVMIVWLNKCYKAGILTDESTGIPLSQVGSLEYIESLIRKISLREGLGDVLALGTVKAADSLGSAAKEQVTDYIAKAGFPDLYGPRLYITTGLIYGMEPRGPIQQLHEMSAFMWKWESWAKNIEGALLSSDVIRNIARRFWGGELAVDFSTYEGKALAAKMIQDREYVKESLILCDWQWPLVDSAMSDDHVGDPSLESKVLSAVMGTEADEQGLYRIGERIFNLNRAVLVREGHNGREYDAIPDSWYTIPWAAEWYLDQANLDGLVPGKNGEVITRKGMVVDKESFEKMKDDYYELRKWDVKTGLQTRAQMEELGLGDIADGLAARNCLA